MVIPPKADMIVVGAGVSGLTTAVVLAEALPGMSVNVLSHLPLRDRTSYAAGASWSPYTIDGDPVALEWSITTLAILEQLAGDEARNGVRIVPGIDAARTDDKPPGWAQAIPAFRMCERDELPDGFVSGWRYRIPLVDMPVYLAYLEERLVAAGGRIELRTVTSFEEIRDLGAITVNCTGMGSRELVPDPGLQASFGQLVVVKNTNPPIVSFFQDDRSEGELTYIFPHGDTVVLGGCEVSNEIPPGEQETVKERILDRCIKIEPRLQTAEFVENRHGVRPRLPKVRLERVKAEGHAIVHNYGHGGSGLTMSWGCAREVLRLVCAEFGVAEVPTGAS